MGSSPLARGLPEANVRGRVAVGIIPARAGFTRHGAQRGDHPPDHPRSRGVYRDAYTYTCRVDGSSPLARGLHAARSVDGGHRRIIPARAGFTRLELGERGEILDHPRSRGVYCVWRRMRRSVGGSSPLARGLRDGPGVVVDADGIIPARAGFTPACVRQVLARGDHPRSRGVYNVMQVYAFESEGSSPLARGLRLPEPEPGVVYGIIPARAGFTGVRSSGRRTASDHPRSRGVYTRPAVPAVDDAGSSPLARGLRRAHTDLDAGPGIIPARAGFTRPPSTPTAWSSDHPRSRGVYRDYAWH